MKLTTAQFAARAGKKSGTVRQWIARGIIRAQKLGRDHRIDARELPKVRGLKAGWPLGKKRK
jgi:excisionase family DNA binding protein